MIKLDFGVKDYDEILLLQKRCIRLIKKEESGQDFFLIGQHYPVITLGIRPNQEANLKIGFEKLHSEGIKVREIHRGGFATYHGPGQIVGYPIFNLRKNKLKIREFIDKLEEVMILTLSEFNISAERKKGFVGVWINGKKIASIGVGVKKGISYHGFALNVNTELKNFRYIVPCGLTDVKMTSMEEIKKHKVVLQRVKYECINYIKKVFGKEIKNYKGDKIEQYYSNCKKAALD